MALQSMELFFEAGEVDINISRDAKQIKVVSEVEWLNFAAFRAKERMWARILKSQ